jgi:DNA-directed RNA polymerase subunit E'/Rpb7
MDTITTMTDSVKKSVVETQQNIVDTLNKDIVEPTKSFVKSVTENVEPIIENIKTSVTGQRSDTQEPTTTQGKEPTTKFVIKKTYKPTNINSSLFSSVLITRKIYLNITNIGNNIKQILENVIADQIEGRCIVEGYVKESSTILLTFSSGVLKNSDVIFDVTFECMVCSPVEGMNIECVAKNITKAGIRAELNETPSPIVVFISRDHHYMTPYFSKINEDDIIKVRVIGQRFELNDKYISIIAELIEEKKEYNVKKVGRLLNVRKPKISIVS